MFRREINYVLPLVGYNTVTVLQVRETRHCLLLFTAHRISGLFSKRLLPSTLVRIEIVVDDETNMYTWARPAMETRFFPPRMNVLG